MIIKFLIVAFMATAHTALGLASWLALYSICFYFDRTLPIRKLSPEKPRLRSRSSSSKKREALPPISARGLGSSPSKSRAPPRDLSLSSADTPSRRLQLSTQAGVSQRTTSNSSNSIDPRIQSESPPAPTSSKLAGPPVHGPPKRLHEQAPTGAPSAPGKPKQRIPGQVENSSTVRDALKSMQTQELAPPYRNHDPSTLDPNRIQYPPASFAPIRASENEGPSKKYTEEYSYERLKSNKPTTTSEASRQPKNPTSSRQ